MVYALNFQIWEGDGERSGEGGSGARVSPGRMQNRLVPSTERQRGERYVSVHTAILTAFLEACNFSKWKVGKNLRVPGSNPVLALKTGEMEPPKASCFLCCKRRVRVWQSTVNQREDGKSECLKHLWVKFPPLGYYGTYMIFNEEGKHADMYLKKKQHSTNYLHIW